MNTPIDVLRQHRTNRNLTGRGIAKKLEISWSHYRRIELGQAKASPAVADKISKFFGNAVTRDQILFPED